jgi:Na+-translocating ferredoxin:NAD+ oxidoreductase RnfC subunit
MISILNYRDFQQIPLNPTLNRPSKEKITQKLLEAKASEKTEIVDYLRCGQCMVVFCHNLSPILIKEAFEKNNLKRLKQFQSDLFEGCGQSKFVCPARID